MSETKELMNKEKSSKEVFETEVVIYAGETAPISGVIVPEYNYKEYQKAFDFRYINITDQKYTDIVNEMNCDDCSNSNNMFIWLPTTFLAGAVLGLISR